MAANYLHGPETIEVENGARPVKTVKSAVIGLIGTAPMGDVNTLVQCLSEKDAAAFGSQFTGFTIPQALDAIYDHGAGTVLVINVLDPAKHKTAIEDEVVTFDKSTGQARLAHPVVANVVVKNSEGSTTHTANTDYRVDAQAGVLTNLGKAIEAGGSVKVSYEYADPSKVTAADIIGGVKEGTINFNTSSDRVRLCYPHVKVYDPVTNTERLEPLSQRAAGLRARVDLDKGYWWSSSNQEILGITGVERQLSAMIDDPQSEVNLLNEQGITTVFSSYGSGLRLWGNRTAAWPTVTHMRNFENVRRTGDVINESIRYFSQQYIDMPITQALIDALTESVNAYGRKMTGDGAVLGFRCWFDPARNPETELAAGHLLLSYKYTPPPPLERLTFETEITSEYLLTLKGGN